MVAQFHVKCKILLAYIRGDIMKFQRIEDLRIDNDKTQADIANLLGCQREVYRRYEKGTRLIPVDYLVPAD